MRSVARSHAPLTSFHQVTQSIIVVLPEITRKGRVPKKRVIINLKNKEAK
jgi:hypothetical protein